MLNRQTATTAVTVGEKRAPGEKKNKGREKRGKEKNSAVVGESIYSRQKGEAAMVRAK